MVLQPIESLAPQQRRTLELLAEGLGNVQIAQRNRSSLESVTGTLENLYTALGIESGLSKQEKRTMAINHFKKNSGVLPIFEQRTPAALLEGFKPWQRKALNLIAQEKRTEEVALEVGLPVGAIEETFTQFMKAAKMPVRDQAVVFLKQVISAISQPVAPDRGYTNGHDKTASAPIAKVKSEAPQPSAPEETLESIESLQEPAPVSAATASEVPSVPAPQPVMPTPPAVQPADADQPPTEKLISPLAAAATREKSMLTTTNAKPSSDQATSSIVAPLADRVKAYIEQNNLTVKQFAERGGLSVATIYAVQKGTKVLDKSTERVEGVLAGKKFSADDVGELSTFDPTSEKLISMVSELAAGQNELDELVRLVFNRWAKVKGPDESKAFAVDILRQYLATESDEARLETLLELRDLMKQDSTRSS